METTPISPQKKLYNYRRENGLCPKCGKPLDRKGFYCEECREKQTAYSRETRELCRQFKICPECRKNKLVGDEKICPECLANKAEYRANHPLSDDKRRKNNEAFKQYSKNLYAERRKAGICVRCGKTKAVEGKAKCFICQSKDNAIHRKRTENRQNIAKKITCAIVVENLLTDHKDNYVRNAGRQTTKEVKVLRMTITSIYGGMIINF